MITKGDLKVLWRSGSWEFMRHNRQTTADGTDARIVWKGSPIRYRPGTSDTKAIYEVLMKTGRKAEYNVPASLQPETILDIGANIGAASNYFAREFPAARILAFEPVPDNYALLVENTASLPNVSTYPIALGAANARAEISPATDGRNLGGFSLYERLPADTASIMVDVRHAGRFLREQAVKRVDLIKIDAEGAEFDVLTSLDADFIANVSWIVGELHGVRDFELLHFLSRWFDIDVRRTLGKRYFMFSACNLRFLDAARRSGWRQRR